MCVFVCMFIFICTYKYVKVCVCVLYIILWVGGCIVVFDSKGTG